MINPNIEHHPGEVRGYSYIRMIEIEHDRNFAVIGAGRLITGVHIAWKESALNPTKITIDDLLGIHHDYT